MTGVSWNRVRFALFGGIALVVGACHTSVEPVATADAFAGAWMGGLPSLNSQDSVFLTLAAPRDDLLQGEFTWWFFNTIPLQFAVEGTVLGGRATLLLRDGQRPIDTLRLERSGRRLPGVYVSGPFVTSVVFTARK